MKVLLVNGSPHAEGCTYTALREAARVLEAEGIQTELFQLGNQPIQDCTGCGGCRSGKARCVFDSDPVNALIQAAARTPAQVYPGDADCAAGDQWCADTVIQRPLGGVTDDRTTWQNRPTYQQVVQFSAHR